MRQQASIVGGIALGEGYSSHNEQPTGGSCLAGNGGISVALYDNPPAEQPRLYRSYLARTVNEAVDDTLRYLPGDKELSPQEITNLDTFYTDYHSWNVSQQDDEPDVATFLIYVRSAKRFFERAATPSHNERCTGKEGDYPNLREWTEACGDSYLSAEVHGGYVVATLEVDGTGSSIEEASNVLRFNHPNPRTGIISRLRSLETNPVLRLSDALLNGLPAPPSSAYVDDKDKTITAEKLADYLEYLQTGNSSWGIPGFVSDVQDGAIDSSISGGIVEQVFLPYESSFVDFCTGQPSLGQAQDCYSSFQGQRGYNERKFEERLDEANFFLNNEADYCWGFSPQSLKDDWNAYKERLEYCLSEQGMANTANSCENVLDEDQPTICDECRVSDMCSQLTLSGMEPQAPTLTAYCTQFNPISKRFTEANAGVDFKSLSTFVCALHGMGGRFAGTGEKVAVSANSTGYWHVDVNSGRTKQSEQVHAQVGCVEKANFTSSYTTNWIAESNANDDQTSPTIYDLNTPDEHGVALNGIKGEMEGGGEQAELGLQYDGGQLEHYLEVTSQQGTLRGYVTSFGLDLPGTETITYLDQGAYAYSNGNAVGDGEEDIPLARVDEAFCYLTRLEGDFDGAGEHVEIYPGSEDDRWHLRLSGACEHPNVGFGDWGMCGEQNSIKEVAASVRCYAYNQD